MIEQTVSLQDLTAGMARCVREWLLPHLKDPMARTQAETLAVLVEALPAAFGINALRAIQADNSAARELIAKLGGTAPSGEDADIESAMTLNAALKAVLIDLAEEARGDAASGERLLELQRFFLASMKRELAMLQGATDFAAMTSQEDAARES